MSNPPQLTKEQQDALKQQAAKYAVNFIQSGMVVGLGSGSTSVFAIRELGERLRRGELRDIVGLPSSEVVRVEANRAGVPLASLEHPPLIDLTIDGADEVDPDLNLIKGGGGALTREKIVAQASKREIIIVDESKLSPQLGTRWPVPVEVLPFAWGLQQRYLQGLGARVELRRQASGSEYLTDQGNFILDCHFGPITDISSLTKRLADRAGIVEHGLFIGMTDDLVVAGHSGVEHRTASKSARKNHE